MPETVANYNIRSLLRPRPYFYWNKELCMFGFIRTPATNKHSDRISIMVESVLSQNELLLQRYEFVEDPFQSDNFFIDLQEEKVDPQKPFKSTLLNWGEEAYLLSCADTMDIGTAKKWNQNLKHSERYIREYEDQSHNKNKFYLENNKSFRWARDLYFSIRRKDEEVEQRKLIETMFNIEEPLKKYLDPELVNPTKETISRQLKEFNDCLNQPHAEDHEHVVLKLKELYLTLADPQSQLADSSKHFNSFIINRFTNFTKNLDNMPAELKNLKNLTEEQKRARKAILWHRTQLLSEEIEERIITERKLGPLNQSVYTAICSAIGALVCAAIGTVATFWMGGWGVVPGAAVGASLGASLTGTLGFFRQKQKLAQFESSLEPLKNSYTCVQQLAKEEKEGLSLKK